MTGNVATTARKLSPGEGYRLTSRRSRNDRGRIDDSASQYKFISGFRFHRRPSDSRL